MIAMVVIIQFTKNLRRSFHATFQLPTKRSDQSCLVSKQMHFWADRENANREIRNKSSSSTSSLPTTAAVCGSHFVLLCLFIKSRFIH